MLKARSSSYGRTTLFGFPNKSEKRLVEDLSHALEKCKDVSRPIHTNGELSKRSKSLRSKLANAMTLSVIFQPSAGLYDKVKKDKIVKNPLWDSAPKGAYFKSRKTCQLLTEVAINGVSVEIVSLLKRLSIYIWKMPKRHFIGLCRKIRAKMAQAVKTAASDTKSPEALKHFSMLIKNPSYARELWFTRNQENCRKYGRYSALRTSTDVDLNALALSLCRDRNP